jgi:hypothetical protein
MEEIRGWARPLQRIPQLRAAAADAARWLHGICAHGDATNGLRRRQARSLDETNGLV